MAKISKNTASQQAGRNRLGSEKSPYLLQHADNPVHWWPWCQEAFDLAEREGRPVFLSIGYATCHWCHVMEHESFEDGEVAAFLNAHFVAVKVDREERPDIDALYMNACQLMTGGGGWPLNVFLTPEKKPFYAATYIPRQALRGHPGIIPLLAKMLALWKEDRSKIEESANLVGRYLRQAKPEPGHSSPISDEPLRLALQAYIGDFNHRSGGFGGGPKFPMPHNLMLLLRLHERYGDGKALGMVTETLQKIRAGGICDQLGFGIHRYAVDEAWRVPHFEKMLYDQALFAMAALEAHQATGDNAFAGMAAETLGYVLDSLRHPEGGFFCGEDADSEGGEGIFYLWDKKEILDLLGMADGERFCRWMGVTERGNFEGRNILFRAVPEVLQPEGERDFLGRCRKTLLEARSLRIRPFLDDKILTGWNGLTIAALARAGAVLDQPVFIDAARRAASFILDRLRHPGSPRLQRRWREGEAGIPGFLEDYGFFCWGLLELYMACFDACYLEQARDLATGVLALFGDGKGGFFDGASDAETILFRSRNLQDGALPSGTAVAIYNLLRLGELTGDSEMAANGMESLARLFPEMAHAPLAHPFLLLALDWGLGPASRVTLAVESDLARAVGLIRSFHGAFLPRSVIALGSAGSGRTEAAALVCREGTCYPATTDPTKMLSLLRGERP
ncbi:MAG: thioredoxin domain-containing protein [Deltaproteobacteria bacterium]|nr:thioredoxin domain-containing protein [Deltaproteobacteria bacterium]